MLPTRDCLSSSNPQLQTNSTATSLEAIAENQLRLSTNHPDPKWSYRMFQPLTTVWRWSPKCCQTLSTYEANRLDPKPVNHPHCVDSAPYTTALTLGLGQLVKPIWKISLLLPYTRLPLHYANLGSRYCKPCLSTPEEGCSTQESLLHVLHL